MKYDVFGPRLAVLFGFAILAACSSSSEQGTVPDAATPNTPGSPANGMDAGPSPTSLPPGVVLPGGPEDEAASASCIRVPKGMARTNTHLVFGSGAGSNTLTVEASPQPVELVLEGGTTWKIVAKPGATISRVYLVNPGQPRPTVVGVSASLVEVMQLGTTLSGPGDAVRAKIGGLEASYQWLEIDPLDSPNFRGTIPPVRTPQNRSYSVQDACVGRCVASKDAFGWLPSKGTRTEGAQSYRGDYEVAVSPDKQTATFLKAPPGFRSWEVYSVGGVSCGKYYFEVEVTLPVGFEQSAIDVGVCEGRNPDGSVMSSASTGFGAHALGTVPEGLKRVGVAVDLEQGRMTLLGPNGPLGSAKPLGLFAFVPVSPCVNVERGVSVKYIASNFAYPVPAGYVGGMTAP